MKTFLCAVLCAVSAVSAQVPSKAVLARRVDSLARAFIATKGSPGVSIAVIGMYTLEELERNISWAQSWQPLTGEEQERLAGEGRTIAAEWGPHFGVCVRRDSKAADRWEIENHGGGMQTAGVGGPILGKGADLLVLDDLVKNAKEALSPTYRQQAWD